MFTRSSICSRLFAAIAALSAPAAFGTTATSLSSFFGLEEPSVIYHPDTDTFVTGDTFQNIQDEGGGVFKMELRYNPGTDGTLNPWWDGDRTSTSTKDRGRAEVKGLGPHLFPGQTFDYIETWRTSPNFQNTTHFAHIWQDYGVLGESSTSFLAQMTLEGPAGTGRVHVVPGGASTGTDTLARNFTYVPGKWITTKIEIYSANTGGYCAASVNGDRLTGVTNIQTTVDGADSVRPKWGLYRFFQTGWNLGDEYVEHSNVQSNDVTGTTRAFSFAVSPGSQTVPHGLTTTYTLTDTAMNGVCDRAQLRVTGLPADTHARINPASIGGSGTSTLTVSTGSGTPPGTYPLTITGMNHDLVLSTTVTLIVQ